MKKSLFITLGLAAVLGLGVGASLKAGQVKEAKADKPSTIYLDLGTCDWGTKSQVIRAHFFTGETAYTDWNDTEVGVMTEDTNFKGLFSISTSSYSSAESIIFHVSNWSGNAQTVNLTIPTDGKNLFTINTSYSGDNGTSQNGVWSTYSESTSYVLDLYGDLLNTNHNAHMFKTGVGTEWAGKAMTKVGGSTNLYSVTYYSALTTVVFNQIGSGTGQTINLSLSGNNGKCLILTGSVDGEWKWNSNTWVALEAATFIDSFMKFDKTTGISTSDETKGTACKSNWTNLYNAYTALSDGVHSDIIATPEVKSRLAAWADANNASFDPSTGSLASAKIMPIEINSVSGTTALVITILSFSVLLAVGGFFFLRKRKEER